MSVFIINIYLHKSLIISLLFIYMLNFYPNYFTYLDIFNFLSVLGMIRRQGLIDFLLGHYKTCGNGVVLCGFCKNAVFLIITHINSSYVVAGIYFDGLHL